MSDQTTPRGTDALAERTAPSGAGTSGAGTSDAGTSGAGGGTQTDVGALPPGLRRGGPDIGDAPRAAEAEALRLLAEIGHAMAERVSLLGPSWAAAKYDQLAIGDDAVSSDADSASVREAVAAAGEEGARRVAANLAVLFAQDPEQQRSTPQQIIRTLGRELTEVLAASGVQPPQLDPFHRERFPDDPYGLASADLQSFGDDTLPALSLAFGVAKTRVVKARRHPAYGGEA